MLLQHMARREARLQQQITHRQQWSDRYSWARVIVFLGGLAASAITFYTTRLWISALLLLLTFVLFGVAVYLHQRVSNSLRRFQLMQQVKRAHTARIQRDWAALPPPLTRELRYAHPFEADLDLLGPRSLHRLLDTAATVPGRQRLDQWLTGVAPPTVETIRRRQALVAELMPRTLLRDRLTVQGLRLSDDGTALPPPWQPDRLLNWLHEHPATMNLRPWVWGLALLAAVNWLLFGAEQVGLLGPLWRISLGLYALLQFWHSPTIAATFHDAGTVRGELEQLQRVLQRLERNRFHNAPHLALLCAPFQDVDNRPSHHMQRIARIAAATGVQGNPVLALLLNAIAPWGLYFAWQLNQAKRTLATLLPDWLDRWAELEALSSLATYGALNPQGTFPVILSPDAASSAPFAVMALGHPLLPSEGKVRNDFVFDAMGSVVILTGSNMAGKSTFLKALALNLALTYAGAPVDAATLTTLRFRLFTCIKVSDSVTDGISYFYAEVRRLKALLDALEDEDALPLFYVVDEIFRGTNNRERLEGSRAYIKALAAKAGVGLVATHDLELVRLADELSTVSNYHFRDEIIDGQMHFDYHLHAGPSPTTNALKIMRYAGLPVA
ncbi:MAG: hypothetical protein R2867_34515 [Caldilineaceae bacterium]